MKTKTKNGKSKSPEVRPGEVVSDNQLAILRNSILLILSQRNCWSGRASVNHRDDGLITVDANKKSLTVTKKLIDDCPEFDAVWAEIDDTIKWCQGHASEVSIMRATLFVHRQAVADYEARIDLCNKRLRETLVPALVAALPEVKARKALPPQYDLTGKQIGGGLGSLYNEADYPSESQLAGMYHLDYSIVALSVPNELPEETRKRQCAKLMAKYEEAQNEVIYTLREGLNELVRHAIDRLTPDDKGKVKQFREAQFEGRFLEFFDTFRFKNLGDDAQLEAVIEQAKAVVKGFAGNSGALRVNEGQRTTVVEQFTKVGESLGKLLQDRPSRKFDFS